MKRKSQSQQVQELEIQLQTARAEATKAKRELENMAHSWKSAKSRLSRPSFFKAFSQYKDFISTTAGNPQFDALPTRGLTSKLRNYAFARSHGYKIPKIYSISSNIESFDFSSVPNRFVLKTSGGSSSHGVLPLIQTGRDEYAVADGSRTLSKGEIVAHFAQGRKSGLAYGKVFAEEFIVPKQSANTIPDDIKIYMAYGEVMHILLRSVDLHGSVDGNRSKYIDADGKDLGPVSNQRAMDATIPNPSNLKEAVEMAMHLSRASGLPFSRVDVFDSPSCTFFGEITRAPGGTQSYTAAHDEQMGKQWLIGEANLMLDQKAGRPVGAIWGTKATREVLQLLDTPHEELPRATFAPCSEWCLRHDH
ncbi:ATP-grasp fold amidoligase family protein [Corynebacterium casei]|uniref:ATP-grasp fold amidoligase family protein n=1 Tax=Corynebacterium casei TaxID=160386 RepID=UPI003FCF0E28